MHTPALNPDEITRRPIQDGDIPFLRGLYATTRDDLTLPGLDENQQRQLKDSQFELQHRHYQQHFPNASFELICYGNDPAGRIYVDVGEAEIRLIDITLLPDFRNRGIGSFLMGSLKDLARQKSLPVRLRVELHNPALRLYQRIGFQVIADEQVNLHLEWNSPQSIAPDESTEIKT